MALTKIREKEKRARDMICEALTIIEGVAPKVPAFTKNRIPHEKYNEELTQDGIEAGIEALRLINNMSGCSADDIDLYRLLNRYLLNTEIRKQINDIIKVKY